MDRIRVIRVLEYVGERKWIEAILAQRGVKGTRVIENGGVIREAIVGDFPEIVEEREKRQTPTAQEMKFMQRFGWEFSRAPATKHDLVSGKVVAHEGDETWTRDLKVAGE